MISSTAIGVRSRPPSGGVLDRQDIECHQPGHHGLHDNDPGGDVQKEQDNIQDRAHCNLSGNRVAYKCHLGCVGE